VDEMRAAIAMAAQFAVPGRTDRHAEEVADSTMTAPAPRVRHTVVLTASPGTATEVGTTVELLEELC
jgi:hypothetical protein